MVTRRHSCFVKKVPAVNLLGSDIKIQKLFFCLWTFQHFLSKLDWFTAISPTSHFPHSWISQTFFCCLFYIFLRILHTGKCKAIETGMILLIMDIKKICICSKTYKLWCIEGVLYWCKYPFLPFLDKRRHKIVTLFKRFWLFYQLEVKNL